MARKPWSYVTGERRLEDRPSSRVRIYERRDVPGRIFLSRAWKKTPSKRPEARALPYGTSREEAQLFADQIALERKRKILAGLASLRTPGRLTLGELAERYHTSTAAGRWSRGHAHEQETCRTFWMRELEPGAPVALISPDSAERIARTAREQKGWSARTELKYLVYLKALTRFATVELGAFPADPLAAVELPSPDPDTEGLDYSLEEIAALVVPSGQVDWRLTLLVNVAYDTGRRRGAIRHLKAEDLTLEGGDLWITFRQAYDKGRKKDRLVPVSEETGQLVADALEREEVRAGGWLLPGGLLGQRSPEKFWQQPVSTGALNRMLKHAEELLGIPHVAGRGFHGIKRRHVTESWEIASGDAALVGDVTGNVDAKLLRSVYRQQNRPRMRRQVDMVRGRLSGQKEGEDAREDARKQGKAAG